MKSTIKYMLMAAVITLFLSSSGTVNYHKYYLNWNNLEDVTKLSCHWVWVGTQDQYDKYLDREHARLIKLRDQLKSNNSKSTKV